MLKVSEFDRLSEVLPLRRSQGMTTQTLGEGAAQEVLLYDESRHKAFSLNAVAAAVWASCDGTRTVKQIAAQASAKLGAALSVEAVELTLAELLSDGLLAEKGMPSLPAAAMSRRRLMAGMGAGAALMVPAIAMVVAPKAAQAYGGCFNCSSAAPAKRRLWESQHANDIDSRPAGSGSSSEQDQ